MTECDVLFSSSYNINLFQAFKAMKVLHSAYLKEAGSHILKKVFVSGQFQRMEWISQKHTFICVLNMNESFRNFVLHHIVNIRKHSTELYSSTQFNLDHEDL